MTRSVFMADSSHPRRRGGPTTPPGGPGRSPRTGPGRPPPPRSASPRTGRRDGPVRVHSGAPPWLTVGAARIDHEVCSGATCDHCGRRGLEWYPAHRAAGRRPTGPTRCAAAVGSGRSSEPRGAGRKGGRVRRQDRPGPEEPPAGGASSDPNVGHGGRGVKHTGPRVWPRGTEVEQIV
jgi:hypothetical protein